MYLSKVMLDMHHPSVRQALRDINDMHRNIMAGFAMEAGLDAPRAEMRILYRIIETKKDICLLVRSENRPDIRAFAVTAPGAEPYWLAFRQSLLDVMVER